MHLEDTVLRVVAPMLVSPEKIFVVERVLIFFKNDYLVC